MDETAKTILIYIVAPLILSAGGIWAAVRVARSQSRAQNGDASESYANAAAAIASLNTRFTLENAELRKENDALRARIEAIEEGINYRVTVEFRGTTPPSVKEVKVEPVTLPIPTP